MEEWRPVKGQARRGAYEVSSEGRIRSHVHRGSKGTYPLPQEPHYLSAATPKNGYAVVGLLKKGGGKWFVKLHVLVADAFLGPRPDAVSPKGRWIYDIDHINGDPSDNRASNLQYITHRENVLRSPKHPANNPNRPRGEATLASKLTEKDVIKIRQMAADGWTRRDLGALFGVSNVCITHAVNRQTWKHV